MYFFLKKSSSLFPGIGEWVYGYMYDDQRFTILYDPRAGVIVLVRGR